MYIYVYAYTYAARIDIIEESSEVKLPTKWTNKAAEVGKSQKRERIRKKIREEKESEERRSK